MSRRILVDIDLDKLPADLAGAIGAVLLRTGADTGSAAFLAGEIVSRVIELVARAQVQATGQLATERDRVDTLNTEIEQLQRARGALQKRVDDLEKAQRAVEATRTESARPPSLFGGLYHDGSHHGGQ